MKKPASGVEMSKPTLRLVPKKDADVKKDDKDVPSPKSKS
mgnify:CR=1 FL=1